MQTEVGRQKSLLSQKVLAFKNEEAVSCVLLKRLRVSSSGNTTKLTRGSRIIFRSTKTQLGLLNHREGAYKG